VVAPRGVATGDNMHKSTSRLDACLELWMHFTHSCSGLTDCACSTALMHVEMAATDMFLRSVYRRAGKENVRFRDVIINVSLPRCLHWETLLHDCHGSTLIIQ